MFRSNFSLTRICFLALLGLACAVPGYASSFSVNPARIELDLRRPNAIVEIGNLSNDQVVVQLHVVRWSLEDNRDVYLPTDEVLLYPPIVTIGPNQKQFLRLGLRRPDFASATEEVAYRLILEEVPKLPPPGFTGLQTVLRISVPIFARPAIHVAPKIIWRAEYAGIGKLKITAENQGNAHVQIRDLHLTLAETDGPRLVKSAFEYLLPRQSRTWIIEDERFGGMPRIKIAANTDAGQIAGEINDVLVAVVQSVK